MSHTDEPKEIPFQRRKDLLKGLIGFSELPGTVLDELAHLLKVEQFRSDAVVVEERQFGDRMFIIEDGIVEVTTDGPTGAVTLDELGAGAMFGEIALVSRIPRRKATVKALTPLVLLSLSAERFQRAMGSYPEVLKKFTEKAETLLSEKLHKVSRHQQ